MIFESIVRNFNILRNILNRPLQLEIHREIEFLKSKKRYQSPKSLIPFGKKMYSQSEEDGIIYEIFNRIGVTNKIFVEIGVGNGMENNTLALLFQNWNGLWIDSSSKMVKILSSNFSKIIKSNTLFIVCSLVTKMNVNEIISTYISEKNIDLLSIDIDGNDFHILENITCISPRVIVIEYNAKFFPPILYCMEYNETQRWKGDDNFGASLKYLEIKLSQMGYSLTGCSLTGANAFFVKTELTANKFQKPFTAEFHYEPARYHLCPFSSGFRTSYKTLTQAKSITNES